MLQHRPPHTHQGSGGNWSGRKEFGRQRKPWGKKGEDWNPPQLGPRPTPVSREDQAARLLMCHMEFMEEMTHEDFDALARCNQSHAPLFRWLEAQFTESGPRSGRCCASNARHALRATGQKLMSGAHANPKARWTSCARNCAARSI
jgi:DNA primase